MKRLSFVVLLFAFAFTACNNEKPFKSEDGLEITQDNKMFQDNFEFLNTTVDKEADVADGSWKTGPGKTNDTLVGTSTCVSLSYHPGSEVKTLHFGLDILTGDYSDCECSDGRMRRGKINMTFSGNYFLEGATTTATAEEFFLDDHGVEGTMTILNMPSNSEGHPQRSVSVTDAMLTAPDGSWSQTWWREQTLEMIGGVVTIFDPFDNVFRINETGGGISRHGVPYDYTTSTPLMVRWNCLFPIVDGVIDLESESKTVASLDYDPIGDFDDTGLTQPCDIKFSITTADGKLHAFFY